MNDHFKPFDKVLVRDGDACEWTCNFFSHKKDNVYVCMDDSYNYCIPYEDNEHLLGTTNEPTPERWRAEKGEIYYYISSNCIICNVMDTHDGNDRENYSMGNYFRTEEEAQAMADRIKAMLKGEQL